VAQLLRCDYLPEVWVPDVKTRLLRRLSSRRAVFGIYGQSGGPLSTKRASRYISAIGKAANVVIDKAAEQYATVRDLRRSFSSRWAKRAMSAVFKDIMRHRSINTTMTYYVSQSAEDVGEVRSALGDTEPEPAKSTDVEGDGKHATIES
jgi:integrase